MRNSWMILILLGIMLLEVGNNTLVKAATSSGMSNFVLIVYSNALSLIFLLPATFISHKIKPIPSISLPIVCRIFLLALCSCGIQMCIYTGIGYSSPTLSSAVSNLTPAFTFLLAILTRMEKLEMRSYSSQAKVLGTVVSIAGAFVINLYRGPPVIFHLLSSPKPDHHLLSLTHSNWVLGGFLFAVAAFLLSLLFIVQAWIMKDYPFELMVTLVGCIIVTIQSTLVAIIAEKQPNAWNITLNLELTTIFYSAVVVVCLRSVVYTWAIRLKGPVFVTIFKPLEMVIAVVLGVTFLGDGVYIGSMIGAAIITVGFYAVMWGKAKEYKAIDDKAGDEEVLSSQSHKIPLLQAMKMNA